METINIQIQIIDHDLIMLHGKKSIFSFDPNTKHGEELYDFILGCKDEIQSVNTELLEALEELMRVYDKYGQLLNFNVSIAREAIENAKKL